MSGNDELFSPEMDVIKYRDSDPGLDLLGALLAVSSAVSSSILTSIRYLRSSCVPIAGVGQ